MYLKRILYENVGPIQKFDFRTQFDEKGNPKPVIIVGRNGSGKSILLSNIVDAFYEMAKVSYNNATLDNGNGSKQYYKTISPDQITIGKTYLTAYAQFSQDDQDIKYIFKSGSKSFDDYCTQYKLNFDLSYRWEETGNFKYCNCSNDLNIQIFEKDIVVYFSPMRYERPYWKGDAYYKEIMRNIATSRFSGELYNPITAKIDSKETLKWLYDIITDSRVDIAKTSTGKYSIVYPSIPIVDLLKISRSNVEKLMSEILGEPVIFRMGNRSSAGRRFSICHEDGKSIVNSIDALSTGQLALFEMFSTIIKYADSDNIDLSHKLQEISGIVVIDEIELHLHSTLQREVLPKLFKLFPKVQFIITSHSPLFLLGMQEQFGEDGITLLEMPSGTQISAEQFSEFGNAFTYYTETEKYHNDLQNLISSYTNDKALIITEGATDWKHFKAAYEALKLDSRYSTWINTLEFEFLEYEPKNSKSQSNCMLQMSCSELRTMCKNYSYTSHDRKIIFIADNDDITTKKDLGPTSEYVSWGNNVYSFCLPVPAFRTTEGICVEHLYKDEELKKEVIIKGVPRRIYLGNEFNENGFMERVDGELMYCSDRNACGPNKLSVIDGSDKKKVLKAPGNDGINYALPKMDFANLVLEKKEPFDNMDFSSFVPIFEMIRNILEDISK